MRSLWLGLKFAVSYFSMLPVRFRSDDDLSSSEVLGAMLLFFPIVGLLLALLTLTLSTLLAPLSWYGILLSAVGYMMLYGFLHTEAVMDVADALYASHAHKDPYTIIKEPTVGAMGVLWVIGVMTMKLSGIVFVLLHQLGWYFVAIAMVSRLLLVLLFWREVFRSSFATQLKSALTLPYLLGAFLLSGSIGIVLLSWHFVVLLLTGLGLGILLLGYLKRRLGFVNGDLLGATLEGVETLLLVGVACLVP